jgi:hypothetical protein
MRLFNVGTGADVNSKEWDQLAHYESFELIKRDYAARHGRDPNTRHAREIAAPFTHARSYFRASQAAALPTLAAAVELVERDFPRVVLELLRP